MNMDESFNLDDIEQLEIENNALFQNSDEVTTCACLNKSGVETRTRAKAWATIAPMLAI